MRHSPVTTPLDRAIRASGLRVAVIAARAGISRWRLWRARAGMPTLTPDEYRALARVLRVPVGELR